MRTLQKHYRLTFSPKKIISWGNSRSKSIFLKYMFAPHIVRWVIKLDNMIFGHGHQITWKSAVLRWDTKYSNFLQKKVVSQSLSFHIIFSIKVYIGHNLVCIQNEQNTIFDFFPTKFGALLILQECPCSKRWRNCEFKGV